MGAHKKAQARRQMTMGEFFKSLTVSQFLQGLFLYVGMGKSVTEDQLVAFWLKLAGEIPVINTLHGRDHRLVRNTLTSMQHQRLISAPDDAPYTYRLVAGGTRIIVNYLVSERVWSDQHQRKFASLAERLENELASARRAVRR